MNTVFNMAQFADQFTSLETDEPLYVDIGGQDPLAVKVKPSTTKNKQTLVVLFHGALGRSKGAQVPSFLNFRRAILDSAHQISIADPGVEVENRVGVGWFAGSEANPAQLLLPTFFKTLQDALNIERVIFVGSSGGGFGALYYSWNLPGSVACASVPQTNAWEYNESSRRFYIEDCWPDGLPDGPESPILDLRELYSKSVPNTVVYIQSNQDHRHFARHMIPFLEALKPEDREKIALKVSFWGRPGHSGAVPPGELDGWIKAAISAPETTAESIDAQYQRSGIENTPLSETMVRASGAQRSTRLSSKPENRVRETDYQDRIWAKMIVEEQENS